MGQPWKKSNQVQLDLLAAESGTTARRQHVQPASSSSMPQADHGTISSSSNKLDVRTGRPMLVAVSMLQGLFTPRQSTCRRVNRPYEDAHNPRTEFPDESVAERAEDIRQRGVLQPLVVHPADGDGRHPVHFGAKRLRAATRAGLDEVPVVVRDLPADRYAQVAENQKRHGLTPLELARFIRAQADAGSLERSRLSAGPALEYGC